MIKTLTNILKTGSALMLVVTTLNAEAEAPSLKMSGFTSIIGLASDQTQKQNGLGGTDPSFSISASDFRLTVAGKSAKDFGYSYVINFKTIPNQNPLVNKNYVEFDNNDIGSLQIGVVKGPDDSMVVDTYSILGATGGIKGSVPNVFNFSEGVIAGTNLVGSADNAMKFNWFSPSVEIAPGFGKLQLAVSYTPNTSYVGKGSKDFSQVGSNLTAGNDNLYISADKYTAFGLKNFVYGLTYQNTFGDTSLMLNAVGVSEHSRLVINNSSGNKRTYALNRTNSYQLSGMLSVKAFDFTASWLDNKKSRLPTAEVLSAPGNSSSSPTLYILSNPNFYLGNSGKSWNVGSRYTFGAYQAAIGYFNTNRKTDAVNKATIDVITTTLDFKALEGLKFFGELNYLRTKTSKAQVDGAQNYYNTQGSSQVAVGNNTGTVLIVGTKVSF